ncbi:TPA: hypothetical protein I7785_06440 [Vibrio vulnificus]|nr:hypothetical protein [Vibrio vulnificus]
MPLSISYSPLEARDQDHSQVGVKMSKCLNNEGQLTLFSARETVSWATFMAAVHSKGFRGCKGRDRSKRRGHRKSKR